MWVKFSASNSERGRQLASARAFEGRIAGHAYGEFIRTREVVSNEKTPSSPLKVPNAGNEELGRFYLEHADFQNAVRYLESAKAEHPTSLSIRNDLGIAYMEGSEESALIKAVGELRQALALNPQYEPALFNLAIAYERLGYLPEAEQQLKLYLQVDSESAWAQEVKSKLQLRQHR